MYYFDASYRLPLDLALQPPYRADMNRRRFLLTALAAVVAPLASEAQQATKEAPLFPPQSGHHPRVAG